MEELIPNIKTFRNMCHSFNNDHIHDHHFPLLFQFSSFKPNNDICDAIFVCQLYNDIQSSHRQSSMLHYDTYDETFWIWSETFWIWNEALWLSNPEADLIGQMIRDHMIL